MQQAKEKTLVFLSAAQPTDQGEEGVVLLLVVVVGGFGGTVFGSPMYTQKGTGRFGKNPVGTHW